MIPGPEPLCRRALLAAFALLLVLLPRAYRLDDVGEGVDEGWSVAAARAMRNGPFSYAHLDDFAVDGYQAKLAPVAEALGAAGAFALGDRAFAYRVPSMLASVATVLLCAAWARRRWGTVAGACVLGLAAFDAKSLAYAQTLRYPAIEQLASLGAFLLATGTRPTRPWVRAILVLACGLLALHAHLLAALVLAPLCAVACARTVLARGRGGTAAVAAALVGLGVHAALLAVLFRAVALGGLFTPPAGGALGHAAAATARAVGAIGLVAGPLGVLGAAVLVLRRGGDGRDRALGATLLGATALFALLALRYDARSRYALALQPFAWLAAASLAGPFLADARRARAVRLAAATVLVAGSSALGIGYLATGGGRDVEAPLLARLDADARDGALVLYDTTRTDPFGRRPARLRAWPRSAAARPDAAARANAAGLAYVLYSAADPMGPLYDAAFRARLVEVETSGGGEGPFAAARSTLYRVGPPAPGGR